MVLYMLHSTIEWCLNFGTWNAWNANLSNGFIYVCIALYNDVWILERGTLGTQISSYGFICCIALYNDV